MSWSSWRCWRSSGGSGRELEASGYSREVSGAGDDPRGSLWVIRGLRGIIVWLCLTALALGAVLEQVWLLVFGGLWLLEEIYETGVLALILRAAAGRTVAENLGATGLNRALPTRRHSRQKAARRQPSGYTWPSVVARYAKARGGVAEPG